MNPKFPSYSVVLTTYNSSSYICKALDSVFAQSIQPSQVIVVDDCSSDKTIELISSYPIKVMQTPVNSGTSIARNLGLSAVQTEIIFSLDADDIWDTHLARDHMAIWNNCDPNLAALGTLMRLEFEDKAKPRVKTPVGSISAELLKGIGLYDLASHNPFFASATSFRTFKLKNLGGWSERPFSYCEDYALLANFLIFGDKIGILPTVNGTYLIRKDNKSSKIFEVFKSELETMEKLIISQRKTSCNAKVTELRVVFLRHFSQFARIFRQYSFMEILKKDDLFQWVANSKWFYLRPFSIKFLRVLLYICWRLKTDIRGKLAM